MKFFRGIEGKKREGKEKNEILREARIIKCVYRIKRETTTMIRTHKENGQNKDIEKGIRIKI